ncbi:MAG: ribokinase [Clostridia bacterium]|nr:ribokinase [Clostridia bacterium]
MKKPKILVVGSLVMDLIVSTPRFPERGETVIGSDFSTAPGGKGANQAVQAARLGAEVSMLGRVGNDDFGRALIKSAADSGVDTSHILPTDGVSSAVGNVQIEHTEKGTENRIIVVPGANFRLTESDTDYLKDTISNYDMVILQHEIPTEVNIAVARLAKDAGVPVMLNPAPSAEVPKALLACLTYIAPNEHEAFDICGILPEGDEGIRAAAKAFAALGVENVLITLGKHGCAYTDGGAVVRSGSVDCGKVVDPTAAGDSFIGAFCTACAAGAPIETALVFANCVAGITVTGMGAQSSLPYLADALAVMEKQGLDTSIFECLKG